MRRTGRRHSVAGSPPSSKKKDSPKKVNARALLTFHVKQTLRHGSHGTPSPRPLLRTGSDGSSPSARTKCMERSASLPIMRLDLAAAISTSLCGDDEGEHDDFLEETPIDEALRDDFRCFEDAGDDAFTALEREQEPLPDALAFGSEEEVGVSTSESNSIISSLDSGEMSDNVQRTLFFSPVHTRESDGTDDASVVDHEYAAVARGEFSAHTDMGPPTICHVRIGEMNCSPIHTSTSAIPNESSRDEEPIFFQSDLELGHGFTAEEGEDDQCEFQPTQPVNVDVEEIDELLDPVEDDGDHERELPESVDPVDYVTEDELELSESVDLEYLVHDDRDDIGFPDMLLADSVQRNIDNELAAAYAKTGGTDDAPNDDDEQTPSDLVLDYGREETSDSPRDYDAVDEDDSVWVASSTSTDGCSPDGCGITCSVLCGRQNDCDNSSHSVQGSNSSSNASYPTDVDADSDPMELAVGVLHDSDGMRAVDRIHDALGMLDSSIESFAALHASHQTQLQFPQFPERSDTWADDEVEYDSPRSSASSALVSTSSSSEVANVAELMELRTAHELSRFEGVDATHDQDHDDDGEDKYASAFPARAFSFDDAFEQDRVLHGFAPNSDQCTSETSWTNAVVDASDSKNGDDGARRSSKEDCGGVAPPSSSDHDQEHGPSMEKPRHQSKTSSRSFGSKLVVAVLIAVLCIVFKSLTSCPHLLRVTPRSSSIDCHEYVFSMDAIEAFAPTQRLEDMLLTCEMVAAMQTDEEREQAQHEMYHVHLEMAAQEEQAILSGDTMMILPVKPPTNRLATGGDAVEHYILGLAFTFLAVAFLQYDGRP